ncbi:MAG: type II toxin-antitoxin system VapC family toxin [Actinomycetota bacterium]|nr:type II toxin-antitoxin system VapC family toxin [Actinomycetota bacterium]
MTDMGTLVDSNVLLDVVRQDPVWWEWSSAALGRCADEGPLVINAVVYSEISASYAAVEELDAALGEDSFVRAPLPWRAAFLAGRAHVEYRRRGGLRDRTLPDFLIGAHAAVLGLRLLTRDAGRYRRYFPTVDVVGPDARR